jgi:hypothetical protein
MKNVIARKSPVAKCRQLKNTRLAIGQIGFLALCFRKLPHSIYGLSQQAATQLHVDEF